LASWRLRPGTRRRYRRSKFVAAAREGETGDPFRKRNGEKQPRSRESSKGESPTKRNPGRSMGARTTLACNNSPCWEEPANEKNQRGKLSQTGITQGNRRQRKKEGRLKGNVRSHPHRAGRRRRTRKQYISKRREVKRIHAARNQVVKMGNRRKTQGGGNARGRHPTFAPTYGAGRSWLKNTLTNPDFLEEA